NTSNLFDIKSSELKKLPYFSHFIKQDDKDHNTISHVGIEKNHCHLKFIKEIDKEILINFLNFLESPDSITTMVSDDFEEYPILEKDASSSHEHKYYLYNIIGKHLKVLREPTQKVL